ncbi:MAG: Gmad2 immunoglobulin-like domain-containing protein [Patescibacteria group bacterium]
MKKIYIGFVVLLFFGVLGFDIYLHFENHEDAEKPSLEEGNLPTKKAEVSDVIRVDFPLIGSSVKSPLVVTGEARGNFFFEGNFPVKVLDVNGNTIASGLATSPSDWMTTEFIPFEVTLRFVKPAPPFGTLVLEKDNPSGIAKYDQELRIPVLFQ